MKVSRQRGEGFAHLEIKRGPRYGRFGIDLWPTAYNLSPAGSAAVATALMGAVEEFFKRRGRGGVAGGPFSPRGSESFMGVSRLFADQIEPLAVDLERILEDPANLQPVRLTAEVVT